MVEVVAENLRTAHGLDFLLTMRSHQGKVWRSSLALYKGILWHCHRACMESYLYRSHDSFLVSRILTVRVHIRGGCRNHHLNSGGSIKACGWTDPENAAAAW